MASLPIPIFVINLVRHSNRRAFMEMQLNGIGLDFEFFDAIDGRLLSADELAKNYDSELALATIERDLTPGEIGCALSHLGIYQRIVANDLPFALVLEDDALIGAQFQGVLENMLGMIHPNEEKVVLLVHTQKYSNWSSRKIDNDHKLVPAVDAYCAHAYLITQAAAKKMLATLYPVHTVADCWNYLIKNNVVNIFSVVPYCIGHAPLAKNSDIEPDRSRTSSKKSQAFRPLKYLYAKIIYQLLVSPLLRIRKQKSSW
jgi:glycosyl transferase family 25